MNKKLIVYSCMAWVATCAALPADPLVIFPQGDFSCTVKVTPHDMPKTDPAHPEVRSSPVIKTMAITQIGKIRCDYILWSDGSVAQVWNLTDLGLTLTEGNNARKEIHVLGGSMRDQASPALLHFDADSVSWVTDKSLVKDTPPGGALHYKATVTLPDVGQFGGSPPTAVYQAWIDPTTLLPLKMDDGDMLYEITFSNVPPAGPLVMPPELQAELKRWQAALAPHRRL